MSCFDLPDSFSINNKGKFCHTGILAYGWQLKCQSAVSTRVLVDQCAAVSFSSAKSVIPVILCSSQNTYSETKGFSLGPQYIKLATKIIN